MTRADASEAWIVSQDFPLLSRQGRPAARESTASQRRQRQLLYSLERGPDFGPGPARVVLDLTSEQERNPADHRPHESRPAGIGERWPRRPGQEIGELATYSQRVEITADKLMIRWPFAADLYDLAGSAPGLVTIAGLNE